MTEKQEITKETVKVLSDQEKIHRFVDGDDWKVIKRRLFEKIIHADSVSNLPDDLADFAVEVKAKKKAVKIITDWLAEVEGEAGSFNPTNEAMIDEQKKEDFIIKID